MLSSLFGSKYKSEKNADTKTSVSKVTQNKTERF